MPAPSAVRSIGWTHGAGARGVLALVLLAGGAAPAAASSTKCWGSLVQPGDCRAAPSPWPTDEPLTFTARCERCGTPSATQPDAGISLCMTGDPSGQFQISVVGDAGAPSPSGTFEKTERRCGESAVYRFTGALQPRATYQLTYPGIVDHSRPVPYVVTFTVGATAGRPEPRDAGAGEVAHEAGADEPGPREPDAGVAMSTGGRAADAPVAPPSPDGSAPVEAGTHGLQPGPTARRESACSLGGAPAGGPALLLGGLVLGWAVVRSRRRA